MPDDRGPDDATVNEQAPDEAGKAQSDQQAPADATELREDAKEDIARAVDAETQRHEAQEGPKATPTQREAEAATAARTPSPEAQEALKRTLERERREADETGVSSGSDPGSGQDTPKGSGHRSAKEMVADGEAPLAPLPGRAEPADKDAASPAQPADADEVQKVQEQASGQG